MENCIFCKIIAGDIPSTKVYESEDVLAFRDIDAKAPVHILVIPKKHIASISALNEQDAGIIAKIMFAIKEIAQKEGIAETGYRVVSNTGDQAGQTVKHLHFHLLGGRDLTWPPG